MSEEVRDSAAGVTDNSEDAVKYVEDLAGPNDYWVSITDAARITRRQDVTIRRWITHGDLPVQKKPIGVNKRTRHVRVSDLAMLTPILDAAAAITGAPANVSLMSIPEEHAHLRVDFARLDETVTHLRQELTATTEHMTATIATQIAEIQRHIESQNMALTRQLAEHLALIESWQQATELRATEFDAALQRVAAESAQRVEAERAERQRQEQTALAESKRLAQYLAALHDDLVQQAHQQQGALTHLEHLMTAQFTEQQQAITEQIAPVMAAQQHVAQQFETLAATAQAEQQAIHKQITSLQQSITDADRHWREEETQRNALAEQVQTLQRQMQELRKAMERKTAKEEK